LFGNLLKIKAKNKRTFLSHLKRYFYKFAAQNNEDKLRR